jgi:hypothetical protein
MPKTLDFASPHSTSIAPLYFNEFAEVRWLGFLSPPISSPEWDVRTKSTIPYAKQNVANETTEPELLPTIAGVD